MSRHVALLGDSSFDNAAYTRGEPDVAHHLRAVLGHDWRVTLHALDGSTTQTIGPQITRIHADVTHIVVSIGGNDALMNAGLLDTPVKSTADALDLFGDAVNAFEVHHRHVTDALAALKRKLIVCTIYEGNLGPTEAPRASVALRMFNDAIVRSARDAGADVIEMRSVCSKPEDFANPIEPSGLGGKKIAQAIARRLHAS